MSQTMTYSPEQTVASVSGDPRILEILKARGVNHCCGAHLSLREAAAAAGVPLDELLAAFVAATGAGR